MENEMKCKALDYYHNLLKKNNYDFEAIKDFLEKTDVGSSIYNESWWEDSGNFFSHTFKSNFTSKEIFDMFDMYKPPNNITDEELEDKHSYNFLSYGDYAPKCQNTQCKFHRGLNDYAWCGYSDWADQCIIDIVYNIYFAFEIGGWSAIDELKPQFNKKIINHMCQNFPQNYTGIKERQIYGGNNMDFIKELCTLKDSDKLFVFWTDNWTYVNDESENQAIANNLTLTEAYKFALLLQADFDYEATDEQVRELGKYLITITSDTDKAIEVWDYLDDIAEDFKSLIGVTINDIDDKRHLVSVMSDCEEVDSLDYGGSATFIAKFLHDIIKNADINPTNYDTAQDLLSEYLPVDDYDIIGFQKALHQAMNYHQEERIIDGSIWINSAKYEYVHKIVITNEEVDIYGSYELCNNNNTIIGSIERENIDTIVEEFYHDNGHVVFNDIKDCLEFDISKNGDW